MRKPILLHLISGIYMFFYFNPVSGETIQTLDDIVVSGTRSDQPGIVIPGSITIITADEIQNSGASHIIEVLRNQGGVQVSDLFGDGSRATISMRGFGGNAQANTLILVDGRRLNNADLGTPDINSVSLKDVDRIEITRGSAGVLYGDQAVGGVINIITKSPDKFSIDVNARYGSYSKRAGNLHISDRLNNGIGYRFSGEKSQADNYRDNNEQDYKNLFGTLDYKYNSGVVFVEYQDIDEKLETPGALFIDQVKTDREQAFNLHDFIQTDTRNIRAGIRQNILNNWQLQAEYTNRIANSNGILSVGGFGGPFVTKRDHRELTPRLTGEYATDRGPLILTAGADIFSTDFFLNSILGSIENDQEQYAAYIQGVIPIHDKISFTVGARYGEVKNEINGALLPPNTEVEDNVHAFEAGLSYRPDASLRLFGRIDTSYRYVLADEYTSASFGGVIPVTQTGRSFETGFDWYQPNATINFVFYQLRLDDEIDFDPILFINTNIGDTRRNGFIVDANWFPVEILHLGLNYSLVDAEIIDGPLSGLEIPFVAKHTVKLTAGYQFTSNLHGQVEALGISKRVATGDFFNTIPSLPGYVVGNVYLAYDRKPFSLGFRINNIFDVEYSDNAQIGFRAPFFLPETTYFPSPERNFLATFSYQFD